MLAITALLYWFFRMATSGMSTRAVASPENSPLPEHTETQADALDAHAGACAAVAARGNLTSRETEILSLLAQGHTQKKVAEALFISISTVQWYARGIYRKQGVHSRQELIDMVDAEMEHANRE